MEQSLDSQQFDASAKDRLIEGSLSFLVIIRHVSNATQRVIKNVLFKFPLCSKFDTKAYSRKFAEYVKRSRTLMRNVRVEFEVVVGSIPTRRLDQSLLSKLANEEHSGEIEEPELEINDFTKDRPLPKNPPTPKLGAPAVAEEAKRSQDHPEQFSPSTRSIVSGAAALRTPT